MTDAPMTTSPVVSAERKRTLLLEARRDRVSWVDAVSVPFRSAPCDPGAAVARERLGGADEGLEVLLSARACASMCSAVDVAKALYSVPKATSGRVVDAGEKEGNMTSTSSQDVGDRIKWLLETDIRAEDLQMAMMSALTPANGVAPSSESEDEEKKAPKGKDSTCELSHQGDDNAFISSYCAFLHKLRTPECAELVQAMRRFVNSFEDAARGASKQNDEDVKRLAAMVQGHITKSIDAFSSHPQWRVKTDTHEEARDDVAMSGDISSADLKQSIETFLFAKCHKAVWSFVSDDDAVGEDTAFQRRLDDLQFITPKHLDIHCLASNLVTDESDQKEPEESNGDKTNDSLLSKQLSAPIRALQSIENQYSPSRMLSCIHDAYRGVNEALTAAMASASDSGTPLPSADDVLPALILVVLRAQPRQIVSNLNFLDLFATPEQLRGEKGYAFTNLFSAVQFLRDLDVDKYLQTGDENGDENSKRISFFSMSPDEFKRGLEKCRQDTKKKAEEKGHAETSENQTIGELGSLVLAQVDVDIPVNTIHSARSKGEVVDLEWAQKWQVDNRQLLDPADELATKSDISKQKHQPLESFDLLPLPDGFTRSYNFLSSDPDDVRISDVPQLLREYQMLVRATESLLSDRSAKFAAEHKRQARLARKKLESAVKEFDE